MESAIIETSYPMSFRKIDAKILGEHIKNRHSISMIGMKRVGVSNFLRFFLYHKDISTTYIAKEGNHLFIPVDLHDLVEIDFFPFWILTLKRISDVIAYSVVADDVKKLAETLFLDSIQTKDLFLTIDHVRKILVKIVESGLIPTIYFVRFDRFAPVVTPQFSANLQGLRDATHQKLAFVFTSYRDLHILAPQTFTKSVLSDFARTMFIKPAQPEDMRVIYKTYKDRYKLALSPQTEKHVFHLVDGYVQYLQLALIYLQEKNIHTIAKETLFEQLVHEERISLQSEELFESLTQEEKKVLMGIVERKVITSQEKEKAHYLWETGMVREEKSQQQVFSPLFAAFLKSRHEKTQHEGVIELTKKEHLLFTLLKKNLDTICEREYIIAAVWPEVEVLGVSDWAIDRLVARVRSKLRQQKSAYEIQTVKTRGYKLVEV